MDSKTKRAAALGYGLAFTMILPVARGGITITDAGHALGAYQYDMPTASAPASVPSVSAVAAVLTPGPGTLFG